MEKFDTLGVQRTTYNPSAAMKPLFPLAPRYRLDDESAWLRGIDPSRHYWIEIDGDAKHRVAVPGLMSIDRESFKQAILRFRALKPGQEMTIERASSGCTLHCISANCYAIEATVNGALVWHLFDCETLESLLMTAHPDWQCAAKDLELGRELLMQSWLQPVAA
jgi:hypothetical protein